MPIINTLESVIYRSCRLLYDFVVCMCLFPSGTDKQGYGFGGTGKKSFGRQFDSYGEVHLSSVSTLTFRKESGEGGREGGRNK